MPGSELSGGTKVISTPRCLVGMVSPKLTTLVLKFSTNCLEVGVQFQEGRAVHLQLLDLHAGEEEIFHDRVHLGNVRALVRSGVEHNALGVLRKLLQLRFP